MENCYMPNNPNLQCLQSSNSSEVCWRPPSPSSSPDADKLFAYANLPPVQEVLGYHRIASPLVPTDVSGKEGATFSLTALDLEPLPGFFTLSPCTSNYSYKEVLAASGDGCKVKGGHDMADVLLSLKHAVLHPGQMPHGSCAATAADHYGSMRGCSGAGNTASNNGGSATANLSSPLSNYYGTSHPTLAYTLHPQHQDGNYGSCPSGAMGSGPGTVASMGVFPMSVNVSMNMTMGVPAMGYAMDSHHAPPHPHSVPWSSSNSASNAGQSLSNYSAAYSHGHASSHHYPAGLLSPIQVTYNAASAPQPYNTNNNNNNNSSNAMGNYAEFRPEPMFDWRCDGSTKVNMGHSHARSKLSGMNFMEGALHYEPYSTEDSRTRGRLGSLSSHNQTPAVTPVTSYQLPPEISPSEVLEDDLRIAQQTSDHTGHTSLGKANLCRVCGKTYARPSTLKTHMRTHTNERPYRCHACSKSFSQAANLTAHARTHTGEKPFRCQICDRRFSQSSSVTTHMRTHSGDRPYRCRMCKKAFSDSSTLTKHMRIHSGEKPYQCKLCMLRFSQSGNLNRHMRVHSTAT